MASINASPADDAGRDPFTESLSVGVVRIDAAGVVTLINGAFARMVAVDGADRDGRTLTQAIGQANTAQLQPLIDGAFAGHRSEGERQLRSPDRVHAVRASFAPERSHDRRIVAAVGTVIEITDANEVEQRRIHRDSQMRDQILSVVSHELRSPLNGVQSWSHVLEGHLGKDHEVDPVVARALDGIRAGIRQQVTLIERLLDATAALTGDLEMAMGPVVVRRVVEAAMTEARIAAAAKGVTFEAAVHIGDEQVEGDAQRLQQVLDALLSNAVRFARAGGSVRLTAMKEGHSLKVIVADDGRGLPAGFDAWLFQPFRQADGSGARRAGGLGLGLALAQKLAHRHGGAIAAASAGPGLGATFTVTLPIAGSAPVGLAGDSAQDAGVAIGSQRGDGAR